MNGGVTCLYFSKRKPMKIMLEENDERYRIPQTSPQADMRKAPTSSNQICKVARWRPPEVGGCRGKKTPPSEDHPKKKSRGFVAEWLRMDGVTEENRSRPNLGHWDPGVATSGVGDTSICREEPERCLEREAERGNGKQALLHIRQVYLRELGSQASQIFISIWV